LNHPRGQAALLEHTSRGQSPNESEKELVALHVVGRIQFVDPLGMLGSERSHLNVGIQAVAVLVAVPLQVLARAHVADDRLDDADAIVETGQLLGDVVMDKVNVQRPRPVQQDVLLSEKPQQRQSILRTEDADALVQQTVRLRERERRRV